MRVLSLDNRNTVLKKAVVDQQDQVPTIKDPDELVAKIKEQQGVKEKAQYFGRIALARKSFYYYCKAKDPSYYTEERTYLKTYCDILQQAYEGRIYSMNVRNVNYMEDVVWHIAENVEDVPEDAYVCKDVIINMPPQHFKSRTLTHFYEWTLGKNPLEHIIAVSYNQELADGFSRYVRDAIDEEKRLPENIVFSEIFPDTKLKQDHKSVQSWAVEGSHFSYASAGMSGTITGKGATIKSIDDPVKNDEVAFNEAELDKQYTWFVSTFTSRKDANVARSLTIINQTLWCANDLTNRIISSPDGKYYYRVKFPAYNEETDTMLCESILDKETFFRMRANQTTDIQQAVFEANYQQEVYQLRGALYSNGFKTYSEQDKVDLKLEETATRKCYVDVADKGSDFLCAFFYYEKDAFAYQQDVLYTQDPQSITEEQLCKMIIKNRTTEIEFESNNGGSEFGRHIEEKLHRMGWYNTFFKYKWNKQNKVTRMITFSPTVQLKIYMKEDWKLNNRQFAKDVLSYQKNGKNKHDDAPDCLTGVAMNLDESCSSCIVEARW